MAASHGLSGAGREVWQRLSHPRSRSALRPSFSAGSWNGTFAWLTRSRRLAKDWERLSATFETWIFLAVSGLMLKR